MKSRVPPAARAGAPNGPAGLRVSAMRQGVIGTKRKAGAKPETLTVTLAEPTSGVGSVSVAETVIMRDPGLSAAVFNWKEKPTLGHPSRPGKALQTSGRLDPYVALPTTAPSTFTCTAAMPVPTSDKLSIAQPPTVTVPDTTEPGAGVSMSTNGGRAGTTITTVKLDTGDHAPAPVAFWT